MWYVDNAPTSDSRVGAEKPGIGVILSRRLQWRAAPDTLKKLPMEKPVVCANDSRARRCRGTRPASWTA